MKASRRTSVKADLLERRRITAEIKTLRRRLETLADLKRQFTAREISARHRVSISTVYWIAAECFAAAAISEREITFPDDLL